VATYFPAPHSYTGEHVVEISAHGSPVVLGQIVEDAMQAGPGPRIHHWGLEVANREAFVDVIRQHGGEILSKPGAPTLRFRAPDRTVVEVVEPGRYQAH